MSPTAHATPAAAFWRGLSLLAWSVWLAGLVLVSFALMAGRGTGGRLPMDASLLMLGAVALPAVVLSPWMARVSVIAGNSATWAGWATGVVAIWWIFWLPATLQGMASSDRYGADNFSVPLPATAPLQLAVVCVALWLCTVANLPWTRRTLGHWFLWTVLSGLALLLAEPMADWAMAQPWLTCAGLLIPLALLADYRLGPEAPGRKLALRWFAAMSLALYLWTVLHHWGGRVVPAGLNELGARLLF